MPWFSKALEFPRRIPSADLGVFFANFVAVLVLNSFAALAAFATRRNSSLATSAAFALKALACHSAFAPDALTTFSHFLISERM